MSEPPPETDEPVPAQDAALLAELGEALGGDPPPAGFLERCQGLLAFAGVDHELAALLEEAAAEPAGLRGPAATGQRLTFEVAGGAVSLEVVVGRERLDGQVLAGAVTEAELERLTAAGGATGVTVPVDELGRFTVGYTAAGPARLRLRGGRARPVTTDWFLL